MKIKEIVVYKTSACGACSMMKDLWDKTVTNANITYINIEENPELKPVEMTGAPYITASINDKIVYTNTGFTMLEDVLNNLDNF